MEEALEAGKRIVTRSDEVGTPVIGRQFASAATLRPLLYLGRAEEVEETRRGRVSAPRRVLRLAHLGSFTEARHALRQHLDEQGIGPDEDETAAEDLVMLLEAAVLLEERDVAATLSSRLSSLSLLATSWADSTCIARLLAGAAALAGETKKAREFYQQALEISKRIRNRPEIALARLGLAELLLEHFREEQTEALEDLDFALAEFREMKMQPSLKRALSRREILKA